MAEKQLAYRAGGKDEFFADDDPLAELARIVGYDKRPSTPVAANQRQDPAFDLEDELLREFERYDAPRTPQPSPAAYSSPAYDQVPANDFAAVQPVAEPELPVEARDEPHAPHAEELLHQERMVHAEPTLDASSFEPAEESWQSVVEPTTIPVDAEELEEMTAAPEAANRGDELEMSIAAPDVQPATPRTQQWAAATIRLPLANFNAPRREPTIETPAAAEPAPVVEPVRAHAEPAAVVVDEPLPVAAFVSAAQLGHPAELDRHEDVPVEVPSVAEPAPAVAQDVPVATVEMPTPSRTNEFLSEARTADIPTAFAAPEPVHVPPPSSQGLDIDDLLADVSRYPVPSREQIAARIDPSLVKPAAPRPAEAAPVAAVPEPVRQPDPEPVAAAAEEDFDGFDEHDFDLDLADIELELAELDFADPKAPAAPEKPAATIREPVADWRPQTPAAVTHAAPTYAAAAASSYAAAAVPSFLSAAAPAEARESEREVEPVVDSGYELPFDPSEISETEDRVETFEDMHVPALPPAEPDEPVAAAPDYDFDIDAEMANLFNAPADTSPEPTSAAPVAEAAFASAVATSVPVRGVTMQQKPSEGLDEFERALEEDFRRSFHETSSRPENVSQMMFESSHTANDRWRARSMRGIAIAAAAVVVLGGGAYGMYRWVSHNGSPISFASGEPRVITADTDPVKVVPTDPGGKVVPNQDKAVYDRVAGAANQPPKQKELVSSDEQPVDVVQKTLIPENSLPDDNDGTGETNLSTPVGETEDPRLLPGQGTATAANSQDGNSAVAPRKVRTMIVKPDGSLVAREEASPADDSANSAPAATPTAPASGNTQMASANDGDAPSADSAPIRMVKTTQLANTPASAQPPSGAPASGASDAAPVPTVRPTQTASATPPAAPKPPVATQPVKVASATQAAQPVKSVPATAVSPGGYGMQIASLPSAEEAKRSQANMAAKYASIIGGHPMEVRKVDIAGKGTYYRVRVAVGSKDDAAALCVKFRAAGGTCLISK